MRYSAVCLAWLLPVCTGGIVMAQSCPPAHGRHWTIDRLIDRPVEENVATLSPDTAPEIERLQIEGLRQMPPWRKIAMVSSMNHVVRTLAMAGLRHRFPDDSPAQLRRRLADLLLGSELAARALGPGPEEGRWIEEMAEPGPANLLMRAQQEVNAHASDFLALEGRTASTQTQPGQARDSA